MFWTLIVMTAGGTPVSTDLVFDSLEACYEAEQYMATETVRYSSEYATRLVERQELSTLTGRMLVRGVCVPHSAVDKLDNLPREMTRPDPRREYPFSPLTSTANGAGAAPPPVDVVMAPVPDYNLPRVQIKLRLIVRNPTDDTVEVRNPLQLLFLSFHRSDGMTIELPRQVPELIADRRGPPPDRPLKGPSNVKFSTAVVNGKEDPAERNFYSIAPRSSLEVIFECENVVGERILAALQGHDEKKSEKHIYVSAVLSMMSADGGGKTLRMEESIRLQMPKP